ncbi:uncharacterized protein PHA67_003499 [Liasis olivaceus]
MWCPVLFLKIISPVLLCLSSALLFSALFTYNWVVRPTPWGIYYEDLMVSCIDSSCSSLNRGWEYNVFVIGFLGTAAAYSALLTIALLLLYIFKMSKKLSKYFKESILMPVGTTLIAMSVYTGYYTNETVIEDRGFSFWLAWSSFLVSFVSVFAAMCVLILQEAQEEEEMLSVIPGV